MKRKAIHTWLLLLVISCAGQMLAQSPNILINEICNDPGGSNYGSSEPEYVELYNTSNIPVDLSNWEIRDNSRTFKFASGTIISANGYVVVTFKPQYFKDHYGMDPSLFGIIDGSSSSIALSNSGDVVALLDNNGTLIDYVAFRSGWMNGTGPSSSVLSGTNGLPAYTGTRAPTSGGNAQDLCTCRIPNGVDGDATPGDPASEDAEKSYHSGPFTPGWANDLPTIEIHDGDIFVRNPDEKIFEREPGNRKKFLAQFPADTGFNLAGIRIWGRYWDANAAISMNYSYNAAESSANFPDLASTGLMLPPNESNWTESAPEHSLRYQSYISGRLSQFGGKIVIDIEIGVPALSISDTYQLEITVTGPSGPLQITSTSPVPAATENQLYAQQIMASGGTEPYTFNLMNAPTWLNINGSNGNVSGTPPVGESALSPVSFTVVVTDAMSTMESKTFNMAVRPELRIDTIGLPNAQEGVAYMRQLVAVGGAGGYTFSLLSPASMPVGLTLDGQGLVSGTPACGTASTQSYQIQVEDQDGVTASRTYTFTVSSGTNCAALDITSNSNLPGATQFQPYSTQLQASGGTIPYTWSINNAPASLSWLSINASTGILSGTPGTGQDGFYNFSVQVNDANNIPVTQNFFISVDEAAIIITSAAQLPRAEEDMAYSTTLNATGGQPPLVWSFSGLPGWLTFNQTNGVLSGTPPLFLTGNQPEATFTFIARVTDGAMQVESKSFRVVVDTGPRPPKSTSSGGGLCSLNSNGKSWALLILAALSACFMLRRREASRS